MKKILTPLVILLIFTMLVTAFTGIASENENPVTNVYGNALERLCDEGIIEGYDDGELHPEAKLTRAQFAKIMNKAFPDAIHHEVLYEFTDLTKEHWAFEDIQVALNAGWLNGFPDKTFRPDDNILYEQALTVVVRAMNIADYRAEYPKDYISSAMEHSVSDGVNALIGDEITRAEAAKIIVNAIDYNERSYDDEEDGALGISSSKSSSLVAVNDGVVLKESVASSPMATMGGGSGGGGSAGAFAPYIPEYNRQNTEEYAKEEENIFKDVLTSPLSTFSIDTDTASYSNLRRFILNGQKIKTGAVRSEELINYFDYEKAETEEGKPFGVKYTVSKAPWNDEHNLAMITVSGEELKERKPSNLVFLIDISGSMFNYNKLPLVKQSLSMLLNKLGEEDTISIVTYASGTKVALEPTPATEKEKILKTINSLRAGGSTAGASGINLAYEQAEKNKIDGNNRIILCTDGDFNVGISSDTDLEALITEKRESGIFLSVLGFGMGNYKDSKMEILADKGNGNYAYIDSLKEAKKVLVDEMSKTIYTIAKDVKIQAEFNPQKVAKYRLIGYENRLLNNEDFENDKKDAGELGAGASVTVLYEIIPATGEETSGLKYQTPQTTKSDDLMTVKIRYKEPDGDESILSEYEVSSELTEATEDFNFAAAVAELGMILNDSEFKGNSTYDSVIELARSGIGKDEFGLRCEFIQLADLLRYMEK